MDEFSPKFTSKYEELLLMHGFVCILGQGKRPPTQSAIALLLLSQEWKDRITIITAEETVKNKKIANIGHDMSDCAASHAKPILKASIWITP